MQVEELYGIFLEHPSVTTDTRQLRKGDVYFALKGPKFNGNEFAAEALRAGAEYAVIDEEQYRSGSRTILVSDVLETLQSLANHHRRQLAIPVIAITGSNGKTTTKELVHAVLSSTYRTYTTQGNLNNHIGVPLTLLRIAKDAEMAVVEMGANHIGEIASYCQIALPTHGIITNCGKAHLEGFGSEEGVRKGKGELFDYLRSLTHGYAFVNWDYDYLREMSKGISGVIKYGTNPDCHVIGKLMRNEPFLEVEIVQGMDERIIRTQLVGDYNLPNVLAAVTVGKFFRVPESKMKQAIEAYRPSNSRSQLLKKDSNSFILDAYNANPSSMTAAIENFAKLPAENKVLVLGAMAELGSESENEHRRLVDLMNRYPWKAVALVGGDFQKIDHPYRRFENAEAAREWLREQNFENTHFLVKGSRTMKLEKILE